MSNNSDRKMSLLCFYESLIEDLFNREKLWPVFWMLSRSQNISTLGHTKLLSWGEKDKFSQNNLKRLTFQDSQFHFCLFFQGFWWLMVTYLVILKVEAAKVGYRLKFPIISFRMVPKVRYPKYCASFEALTSILAFWLTL